MELLYDVLNLGKETFIILFLFGIFFFFIENMNKAEKKTRFLKKDFSVEIFLILTNKIVVATLVASIVALYSVYVLENFKDYQVFFSLSTYPPILQLVLALVVFDFFSYWRHRMMHRFFWNIHAIHHSAEEITWITRHRFHPIEHIISIFFEVSIMFFIGISTEVLIFGAFVINFSFYLSHANIQLKYIVPFRYIMISPHFHRWHHANQKEAYDKNFAGVFPFWDKLFGTYYHPEELPKGYGLNKRERKEYKNTPIGSLVYPFLKMKERFKKK